MQRELQIISPIAIDLGGKYTGVYMPHYQRGTLPEAENTVMATIVASEDGDKVTWSQINRTQTRHRIRSNKRRKLAKRLLAVVLAEALQRKLTVDEWSALSGLLNRRGYNRLEVELDLSCLDNASEDFFADILPSFFTEYASVSSQWSELSENIEKLRELQKEESFSFNKRDAKKELVTELDKELQEPNLLAYHTMQEAVEKALDAIDFGHQHRENYLKDVKDEIKKDTRLNDIKQTLGEENLYRLIGNVSNFQLRNLRWYFNDKSMKQGDKFNAASLKETTVRWLQYWHPKTVEEISARSEALEVFQQNKALQALMLVDPVLTIPPYEDQNNRRPPKDQTLWLNPLSMSKKHGERWLVWAQKLERLQPEWAKGIDENLKSIDRNSRLNDKTNAPLLQYHAAVFLQRILDRSKTLDPYALRLLSKTPDSHKAQEYLWKLEQDLGSQHLKEFLAFAKQYYQELADAKDGIWFEAEESLFELANINPPSKEKIKHRLVGNVLSCEFTKKGLNSFINTIWNAKVVGNSRLKNLCKAVEEQRKKQGNAYKLLLSRITYRIQQDPTQEKKLKGDEKEIWLANQKALQAAEFISKQLEHNAAQYARYANSFSMAQLYTLLETDRHGFSKTSLVAHEENAWRMQDVTLENGATSARCSRLVADSVRPFDGILRRTLERQAYEIASLKEQQIKNANLAGKSILVPLIAEENKFEFSLGLAGIKKNRQKEKELLQRLEAQRNNWADKIDRIKSAADSICPYTGKSINQYGEIDHIVPRSASRDQNRTIYNSEANLIWASREGNQKKLDQRYSLRDLHNNYLQHTFYTVDLSAITTQIEQVVNKLPERFIFIELGEEQQIAVRHALFLEGDSQAYQKVFRSLSTQQSTRVNGTQAWLLKRLIELLRVRLGQQKIDVEFVVARTQAEATSKIRTLLAELDNRFAKQQPQPIASHSLDALCAFAAAASDTLANDLALGGSNTNQGDSLEEDIKLLRQLVANEVIIRRIERKPRYEKESIESQPIFKEGIYAEHFLPLWVKESSVFIGFDGYQNAQLLQVTTKDPKQFLDLLQPLFANSSIIASDILNTDKPLKFEINKNAAFELFSKAAKQPCDDEELEVVKVLDGLRFTTSNKDCAAYIYDANKKSFKSKDEILKPKNFEINIAFNSKIFGKAKGKLQLPAHKDWLSLLQHPEIKEKVGTKEAVPNWQQLFADYFNSGTSRSHGKTRRVYSLPIIDAPSGGYRVKRKTPQGTTVWQLMAIDGTSSKGFLTKEGNVLWNQTASIDSLNTPNLTEVGARYFAEFDGFVGFNQWLELDVEHPNIQSVRMAPGTKDRRYIEITQSLTSFNSFLHESGEATYTDLWNVPNEIKIAQPKAFLQAHGLDVLGSPRSNLFLLKVGDIVTYWYIVESSNAAMKDAYQASFNRLKQG